MLNPENVERIIDADEIRTFERKGVEVWILDGFEDGNGCSHDGCLVEFENPVPVIRENKTDPDNLLGYAALYLQGNVLTADMSLRYDVPERLAIEVCAGVYPSVNGVLLEAEVDSAPVDLPLTPPQQNSKLHCKRVQVKAISLGLNNCDKRIRPIT